MGGTQEESGGELEVPQPNRDGLTEDELFELLSNQRRRHILYTLMREEGRVDVGTIAQEIAAREDGLQFEEVSSSDRKRVYTALQQSHLPKLDKAGVVEFDRDRGTIGPTPALEDVEIYMNAVRGREVPWSEYYLGLTALIGIVLGGVTLELAPFTALPEFAWMVFVTVTLGASALAHRHYARRNRPGIGGDPAEVELEYRESTDG